MKKIMLAAVAASFVSTGASAVQLPAEGEVCSSIHSNISVGINNPELSDYRKCVMIQHGIDTATTYKTFWVRTGDMFTSFALDDLRKMNGRERVEHIKDTIIKEVIVTEYVEVIVEKIVVDTAEVDRLTGELAVLQARIDTLAPLAESIPELVASIESLETLRDDLMGQLDTVTADLAAAIESKAVVTGDLEAANAEITRLESQITDLQVTNQNAILAAVNNAERITNLEGQLETANDSLEAANMTISALQGQLDAVDEEHEIRIVGWYGPDYTAAEVTETVSSDGTINITSLLNAARNDGRQFANANRKRELANALGIQDLVSDTDGITHVIDLAVEEIQRQAHAKVAEAFVGSGLFGTEADIITALTNGTLEDDLMVAITQAYDDGYDDGFVDGYQEGYADATNGVAAKH